MLECDINTMYLELSNCQDISRVFGMARPELVACERLWMGVLGYPVPPLCRGGLTFPAGHGSRSARRAVLRPGFGNIAGIVGLLAGRPRRRVHSIPRNWFWPGRQNLYQIISGVTPLGQENLIQRWCNSPCLGIRNSVSSGLPLVTCGRAVHKAVHKAVENRCVMRITSHTLWTACGQRKI